MLNNKENNFYLESGKKTNIGPNVMKLAELVHGNNTREIINSIMHIIITQIPFDDSTSEKKKFNSHDSKKFKRSAEEIICDKYRNGCCDSSTLFVALCRAKGIPSAQIITVNINAIEERNNFGEGHFFSAYYNKERNHWVVIDTHKKQRDLDNNNICHNLHKQELLPDMRFLDNKFYIFACVRDYSEFCINGIRIDSIHNMNLIHRYIYREYLKQSPSKTLTTEHDER